MLVSYDAWYTKLSGNCGTHWSGSGQTTPVYVGVTCGSGRSVVRVGMRSGRGNVFQHWRRGKGFSGAEQRGTREARG